MDHRLIDTTQTAREGSEVFIRRTEVRDLVSNTAKELVARSGITFLDRGTHILKGFPGEWRLCTPDVPKV